MSSKAKFKGGKVPQSEKPKEKLGLVTYDDIYTNPLQVPNELKEELEEAGLSYKFINGKELVENHGFHHAGWKPYKPKCQAVTAATFGADPEGYFRRGDLILAVLPKEVVARQKAFIKQKAQNMIDPNNAKRELKALAQRSGVDARVTGWEEDEDQVKLY